MKTYEILTNDGKYRIKIPEDFKVTFGPIAVGGKLRNGGYGESGGSLALRVYESDAKQRAIFTGVRSFRDLSIPLMHEEVKISGNTTWSEDATLSESQRKQVTERRWVEVEN